MNRVIPAIVVAAALALPAQAGFPVIHKQACPIGGEEFEITTSPSCSYGYGEFSMLLSTSSSCDFVTRLPECPENGLPLYKDFQGSDIPIIERFMQTSDYKEARMLSRFYLAAKIEEQLIPSSEETVYNTLAWGFRTEPKLSLNKIYRDAYINVAENFIQSESVDDENRPFEYAFLSYIAFLNDDVSKAEIHLNASITTGKNSDSTLLKAYQEQLRLCFDDPKLDFCEPTATIVIEDPEE